MTDSASVGCRRATVGAVCEEEEEVDEEGIADGD